MLPAALADIIYTTCGGRQYAANNFCSLQQGRTEQVKKNEQPRLSKTIKDDDDKSPDDVIQIMCMNWKKKWVEKI